MEEQKKEIKKRGGWSVVGIILFISYFILLGVIVYFQWGQGQRYYMDGFNGAFGGLGRDFYSFFVWLATLPVFTLTIVYAFF